MELYVETIEQVPPHLLKEITHFFETYKNLENKHVIIIGWEGLKTATNILQEAKSIYVEQNEIADGHSALNKLSDSY